LNKEFWRSLFAFAVVISAFFHKTMQFLWHKLVEILTEKWENYQELQRLRQSGR